MKQQKKKTLSLFLIGEARKKIKKEEINLN